MLLRNRLHNSQAMISAGGFCLVTGIVAQRFIHPPTDFWQGFVAGISGMLIGLSIVFNMRGLMLRRKEAGRG
ncbi:MAG: hypothetical protein OQK55_08405 [Thermoanaerobaculales bacterium]|nr:hypothetical protein [Thermoanaerobaculales bacterium]